MRRALTWIALAAAAAACALAVVLVTRSGASGPGEEPGSPRRARGAAVEKAKARQEAIRRRKERMGGLRKRPSSPKADGVRERPVLTAANDGESEFTEAERVRLDAVQAALDGDDLSAVLKAIAGFERERDPRLRRKAVEALSWFGEKAVPELAKFLSDGDEDVSGAANDAIVHAMGDFEESENGLKAEYIRTILSAGEMLDDNAIFMMAGELRCILDNALVAQTAADIIASTSDARISEAMKEIYEFSAGEPYTTPDAAQARVEQIRAEVATEVAGDEPAFDIGASADAPDQEINQ